MRSETSNPCFGRDRFICKREIRIDEVDTTELENWKIVNEGFREYSTDWVTMTVDKVDVGNGKIVDYTHLKASNFSVVFPVTPEGKIVCLLSYRHGPRCVNLTFPAGSIDSNENAREAAIRELGEETRYRPRSMERLLNYPIWLDGNYGLSQGNFFIARDAVLDGDMLSYHNTDLEKSKVILITEEELREYLNQGMVTISAHFICAIIGLSTISPS